MTQPSPSPVRIQAIDTLRGLDMFWLTIGLPLFLAVARLLEHPLPEFLQYHATHVEWIGFAAWDLVMPLFIFIVGTAMPFSFSRRRSAEPMWKLHLHIVYRAGILFLLGMVAQGNLLSFNPDAIKLFCNTLQAIAGGYLIASLCILHLSRTAQIMAATLMLIAYWVCLEWIPFGNHAAGTLLPNANIALYIDHLLEGSLQDGSNYAWILPQLSFGALTLLGCFAGQILQSPNAPIKRLATLIIIGILCLALGYMWSFSIPIIKRLFTPSMTLWAAGWCFLLLAACYLLIDILKQNWIAFPFKVLGSNAIFLYIWATLMPPEAGISRVFFSGFSSLFGDYGSLVFNLCNCFLVWGVLYFLYKKKTFIKI